MPELRCSTGSSLYSKIIGQPVDQTSSGPLRTSATSRSRSTGRCPVEAAAAAASVAAGRDSNRSTSSWLPSEYLAGQSRRIVSSGKMVGYRNRSPTWHPCDVCRVVPAACRCSCGRSATSTAEADAARERNKEHAERAKSQMLAASRNTPSRVFVVVVVGTERHVTG